jgi:hypothetical protein
MRQIGQDVQVVFRSPASWREGRDAFTRTVKAGPLVELELTEQTMRQSCGPTRRQRSSPSRRR